MQRTRLPCEIACLVGIKLALLMAIYLLWFGPSHRVDPALHIETLLFSSLPR